MFDETYLYITFFKWSVSIGVLHCSKQCIVYWIVVMLINVRIGMMKSDRVTVPLAPEVKEKWQKWADKKGMSLPAFIRYCVGLCVDLYEKKSHQF